MNAWSAWRRYLVRHYRRVLCSCALRPEATGLGRVPRLFETCPARGLFGYCRNGNHCRRRDSLFTDWPWPISPGLEPR